MCRVQREDKGKITNNNPCTCQSPWYIFLIPLQQELRETTPQGCENQWEYTAFFVWKIRVFPEILMKQNFFSELDKKSWKIPNHKREFTAKRVWRPLVNSCCSDYSVHFCFCGKDRSRKSHQRFHCRTHRRSYSKIHPLQQQKIGSDGQQRDSDLCGWGKAFQAVGLWNVCTSARISALYKIWSSTCIVISSCRHRTRRRGLRLPRYHSAACVLENDALWSRDAEINRCDREVSSPNDSSRWLTPQWSMRERRFQRVPRWRIVRI